ncbi:MAG: hypothetical protein AABY22_26385 [Nanoarchaeota archaeon]
MIYTIKQIKQKINNLKNKGHWNCKDCDKNTFKSNTDYYVVTKGLWIKFGVGKDMLCISCFQTRLGRPLTKEDFIDCGANKVNIFIKKLQ